MRNTITSYRLSTCAFLTGSKGSPRMFSRPILLNQMLDVAERERAEKSNLHIIFINRKESDASDRCVALKSLMFRGSWLLLFPHLNIEITFSYPFIQQMEELGPRRSMSKFDNRENISSFLKREEFRHFISRIICKRKENLKFCCELQSVGRLVLPWRISGIPRVDIQFPVLQTR